MALDDERVLAGDPEEEDTKEDEEEKGDAGGEEEEEEEELVDIQDVLRDKCRELPECQKLEAMVNECAARVNAAGETEETCHEEQCNFMLCVDHCVGPQLFSKLK